jgi:hypothetical protein
MKKQFQVRNVLLLALSISIITVSCKKAREKIDETKETIEIGTNYAITENLTEDTYDVLTEAAMDKNILGGRTEEVTSVNNVASCATVTATGNFPNKTITIDFGNGCTSQNGVFRKGIITVVLTDSLRKPGSVATVNFNNYYVNTYKKEGTITWTNTTQIGSGTKSWNRVVTNGKITSPTGKYWTHNSNIVLTQTAGVSTAMNLTDDIHTVTGTHSVTTSDNKSRTMTTQTALQKKANCSNVDQGILNIQGNNHTAKIDFGNGTCDNLATVSIDGGASVTITLR